MRIRPARMYVYPTFERKLKLMAVEENKSVISLTRDLSQSDDFTFKIMNWKKNDKRNIFRQ